MDAHHPTPDIGRGVFDVGDRCDARVVDQAIEPSEVTLNLPHDLLPRGFFTDVLSNEVSANLIRMRLSCLRVNVSHHHLRPFAGKHAAISQAEARCGARDDDDFIFDSIHIGYPF